MTDPKLDDLLKSLPRARAGSNFTRDVMRRIGNAERPRRESRIPWPRVALAASLLAAVLMVVGLWHSPRGGITEEDRAALDQLRAEYATLSSELDALRDQRQQSPLVYIGGNESVSFVLDLDDLARATSNTRALPASDGGQTRTQ